MFGFNNKDDYVDLRRQEEYERQKQLNFARGLWHVLYWYILYFSAWLFLSASLGMLITFVTGLHQSLSTFVGMIVGFFLFKVPYIKHHPVKTIITTAFLLFLMSVAFPESS